MAKNKTVMTEDACTRAIYELIPLANTIFLLDPEQQSQEHANAIADLCIKASLLNLAVVSTEEFKEIKSKYNLLVFHGQNLNSTQENLTHFFVPAECIN